MKTYLMRVEAPHYVAGIVFENQRPVQAAPILYWVVKGQRSLAWCQTYFRKDGFQYEVSEVDDDWETDYG